MDELNGVKVFRKLDQSGLSEAQKQVLDSQIAISQIKTRREIENFIRPGYPAFSDISVPKIAYYQGMIQYIEGLREKSVNNSIMWKSALKESRESLKFWESFKE